MNYSFLPLLIILLFSCSSQSKLAKTEEAISDYQRTKQLVESGQFQFEAKEAFPLGNDATRFLGMLPGSIGMVQGNSINLMNNPNHLRINNRQANIDLPYFGRVFVGSNPGSRNAGINYVGELSDYEIRFDDEKRKIIIEFNADKNSDKLQFLMEITSSGRATLNVNSRKFQSIRYQGEVSPLEKPKKEKTN